jgi:hypothetical protein
VTTVERAVAGETARWKTTLIEESVFGSGDSSEISGMVDRFCEQHLESAATECLFYRASVGCVIGLALANGKQVVLKVYQERWPKRFLDAVRTIQGHLARHGFPCAQPLLAATPLGGGRTNLVITETWRPVPGMAPIGGARARMISVEGLARQVDLCRGFGDLPGLSEHPQGEPAAELYPEPHSPLFDFAGTAEGAEWIDAFAARGREQRATDDSGLVVAHTDWCARNVRITDHLEAVYDWDSLALVTESTAVAQAATTWTVTSEPGGSAFPPAAEIAAYLKQFQVATGRRWSREQWRAAGGAASYLLAYVARCEHALAVTGSARPDQRGATERLRSDGEALLNLDAPEISS